MSLSLKRGLKVFAQTTMTNNSPAYYIPEVSFLLHDTQNESPDIEKHFADLYNLFLSRYVRLIEEPENVLHDEKKMILLLKMLFKVKRQIEKNSS